MKETFSFEDALSSAPTGAQATPMPKQIFSFEDASIPQSTGNPGLMQQIKQGAQDIHNKYYNDNLANTHPLATAAVYGLRQAGNVVAPVIDEGIRAVGHGIGTVASAVYNQLPSDLQNSISKQVHDIARSNIGQKAIEAYKFGGDIWDTFKEKNPEVAQSISDIGNVLTAYQAGKLATTIAKPAIEAAPQMLEQYGQDIAKQVAGKELPSELSSLNPLASADKTGFFPKKANKLEVGLSTNNKISEMYHAAKDEVGQADRMAREIAPQVSAPGIYSKLDDLISNMETKVAPGSKEQTALNNLKDIRDRLLTKNPLTVSVAGEPVAQTISASDLMDIEKSINGSLGGSNFVKSGGAKLLDFKSTVQGGLQDAMDQNTNFANAYQDYKQKATNLMKTYVNNKSLRPFWDEKDAIAWKAAKNNPALSLYSDSTFTKANKILENLNTNDLGKITAITNALPPKEAQELLQQAFLYAKQNKVGIGSALLKLKSGNPIAAARDLLSGSVESPLEKNITNIQGLKK